MKTKTIVISTMTCVVALLVWFVNVRLDTMAPSLPARVELHESWAYADSATTSTQACASPRTGTLLGTIDEILKDWGNIAFNVPIDIKLDDTAIIELNLGAETSIDELKRMIEAAGEKYGDRIQVSNIMEARLSGTQFFINAVTPEKQPITRIGETKWKWEVEPKKEGHHKLHLTLSALVNIAGSPIQKSIRTYDKEIEVKVTFGTQVSLFFKKNWQYLFGLILVPSAVPWWWGILRKLWGMLKRKIKAMSNDSGSDR